MNTELPPVCRHTPRFPRSLRRTQAGTIAETRNWRALHRSDIQREMAARSVRPRAILLDLDDTIIDYGGDVDATWRTVCAEAAQQVADLNDAALVAAIHRVRRWYWSDPERHRVGRADLRAASRWIVEQALRSVGIDQPQLAHTIAEQYRDFRDARLSLFPGAVETLEHLRTLGCRLGMVTNGSSADQRAKIERFGLARYFHHILIEGEFGCGKPDTRVYQAMLRTLDVAPHDAWFVGDNLEWDVAAPQRHGLFAIWVDTTRTGLPSDTPVRPQRIIHALSELQGPD